MFMTLAVTRKHKSFILIFYLINITITYQLQYKIDTSYSFYGYDPQSCQTKDYTIGSCSFFAAHAALRSKKKTC